MKITVADITLYLFIIIYIIFLIGVLLKKIDIHSKTDKAVGLFIVFGMYTLIMIIILWAFIMENHDKTLFIL